VVLVGRDPRCHVAVRDAAVARLQVTLFRLHRRWAVFDDGSDVPTLLNDEAFQAALLACGDRVGLGDTELVLEAAEEGPAAVDRATLGVLCELKHGAVAGELVAALERAASAPACARDWAERLFPGEPSAAGFAAAVRAELEQDARVSRALLPQLLGAEASDPAGWRSLLRARQASLPVQVSCEGVGSPGR
jgi:hypothetical protein